VGLSGAQDEYNPLGGFLEGFQQGIKGFTGDLVGFIDNENLIVVARGPEAHAFAQLPHFIDAAIGGSVDFDYIH